MQAAARHSFQQTFMNPQTSVIEPNCTALIVVDMQYFDAHPEWGEGRTALELGVADAFTPYFAQIETIIPRIQSLLSLFREKQMEVIHIRVAEQTKDSRDVGWKQLARGLVVPCDSKEAEPLTEVAPIDDELVISKSSSGVFATTNLDRLLRNLGIQTLVFTGTATGGCIESAVRDAVDLGYNVLIAIDACADSTPASHEQALQRMKGGLVHLLTTTQLKEKFRVLENGSRQYRSGLERVKKYRPKPLTESPGPDVNPYSLIFPPPIQLPLSAENCAFVMVDAQRFACDPTFGLGKSPVQTSADSERIAYYKRAQRALSNMATLLDACRHLHLTVIHVRTAAQMSDGRDLSRHLRVLEICPVQGTAEADCMPLVQPAADEVVLNKPGLGIFTGTGLDELLRNLAIDCLILVGISFAGGLEGSIRSASDRGYGVVLAPDACATYHQSLQEKLSGIESGIINVRKTSVINAQLRELGHSWEENP
ncbi:cysteine hydrolase [Chloroflexi bacterium TSY]|nr:cysteine hydrolase [Chloroflexi bacterium TSY]